jgi:formylglycine-generating enzyme required for sulfatase activity
MVAPVWITVPSGSFLMGSLEAHGPRPYASEAPQQRIALPTFYISRVPMTNAQYERFLRAAKYPAPGHWRGGQIPAGKADHPVTYVDWLDAQAYCEWAGVRLPSEAEWEKAARGTDGRTWPWGDDVPGATHCNFNNNVHGIAPVLQDTSPVRAYPAGASPYGVLDMAGNVWEWTNSLFRRYPFDALDGRESKDKEGRRAVRGGTYNHDARKVRCTARAGLERTARDVYTGFRVAMMDRKAARADDLDWVEIPSGEFLLGSDANPYHGAAQAGETPQHMVHLPEFQIGQTPVTNAQYREFVTETGCPAPGHWRNGSIPRGREDHPVTYVDWYAANAFCAWVGGRLPSEAEWEKAARGNDGRLFPWGDARPVAARLNYHRGTGKVATTPVGAYPAGASPYGTLDMAGNVWEWVSTLYAPYPYDAVDGRESAIADGPRVLRGGSFASQSARYVRCAMRSLSYPARRREHIGFRVVRNV